MKQFNKIKLATVFQLTSKIFLSWDARISKDLPKLEDVRRFPKTSRKFSGVIPRINSPSKTLPPLPYLAKTRQLEGGGGVSLPLLNCPLLFLLLLLFFLHTFKL